MVAVERHYAVAAKGFQCSEIWPKLPVSICFYALSSSERSPIHDSSSNTKTVHCVQRHPP